jgi:hypothetical protein
MKKFFLSLVIVLTFFNNNSNILRAQNTVPVSRNYNDFRTITITASTLTLDSGNIRTVYLANAGMSIYDLRFNIPADAEENTRELLNPQITKNYTLMVYIRKTSDDSYVYGNFYVYNNPVETFNSNVLVPITTRLNQVRGSKDLDILRAGYSYEFIFTRVTGADYFSYTLKL